MFISKNLEYQQRTWGGLPFKVREELKDRGEDIEDFTAEEILVYLCGDYDQPKETDLDIYFMKKPRQQWYHRMNRLWAIPVHVICIPYRYIRYGSSGWTNKTLLGRFILRAVGEDHDG